MSNRLGLRRSRPHTDSICGQCSRSWVIYVSSRPCCCSHSRTPTTGQEDDDHNPDRVKPRHVFNLGLGSDNLFHTEKHTRVTASLEIANLTNKVALYNFLSTFSGTHFLHPRTAVARIGLVF